MVRINKWSIVFMLVVLATLGPGIGLSAVRADSSTITWTAAGNGDWGTSGNWDLKRVPGTGDHVVIPTGHTVTLSSGTYDIGSIDCSSTLNITNGTLNLNDTTMQSSVNILNMIGSGSSSNYQGTLGGSGNLTITGGGTWSGGSQKGGGTTTIAPGATVNINTDYYNYNMCRTLENNGTVINKQIKPYCAGLVFYSPWGAGTINNNGTFDLQGDNGWVNNGGANTATFNNNATGILKKSAGTGSSIAAAFNNKGTVLIEPNCGTIYISTTYTQDSTGILRFDVSGKTLGTGYNQLQVSGQANLAGNLDVNLLNSYVPASTDSFTVMTYGSNNGTFNTITNAQGHTFKPTYNSKNLVLQIGDPAPSISGAAISPTSGSAGAAQNVSITVTTARAGDGTAITANLLDGSNGVKSSVSGTVTGNTANLILAVPSTLAAGSYQVQVVLSGAGNSPYNAGSYIISPAPVTLQSIAITNPASRLVYNVGEALDIGGLEVTGTYSDGSKKIETVAIENISGFNSSTAVASQTLTITIGGKSTTYTVEIKSVVQTFTVTFVSNGDSSVEPKTVVSGGYVDAPPTPVKSGCTFSGWYIENATTPFAFASTPISSNITLYGRWMQSGAGGGGESFPIFTALPSYFEQFLSD